MKRYIIWKLFETEARAYFAIVDTLTRSVQSFQQDLMHARRIANDLNARKK